MTTIAVLVDPPRPGHVLRGLTPPLTPDQAADLYAASVADTFLAVANSGGDLLVNYRDEEDLPVGSNEDQSGEEEVRAIAEEALETVDDVRFEVQVGSTFSARAGNTATHLLREEDVTSVAILDGTAPFVSRPVIDAAAMKLRRSEVVLGPAHRGGVSYVGLTNPIDFEGAWTPPALQTVTDRAETAGLAVDFIERQPVLRTEADLATVIAEITARSQAGRQVPRATAATIERLGLHVVERDDGVAVVAD